MFGKSTKHLPDNYHHVKTLNLLHFKEMVILIILAIGMLFLAIYLFDQLIELFRTEISDTIINLPGSPLTNIIHILIIAIIIIGCHEAIHGVLFWINTNECPIFAYKFFYAYSAAPQWYIPRGNFILIGLSPAIIITLIVTILIIFVPFSWIKIFAIAGVVNFAGSTGDLAIIIWLLTLPNNCLVRDSGEVFDVYNYCANMQESKHIDSINS